MKRNRLTLLAVLTLGSLVALSTISRAEDAPAKPEAKHGPRQGGPGGGPGARGDMMKKMAEELNLTDNQKEKLKPIMKEQGEKMKAVWDDAAASQDDKRAKMKEIRDAGATKIKAVLTPEQLPKFEAMQKENQERMKKFAEGRKPGAPKKDETK
jgi:protein CpxP